MLDIVRQDNEETASGADRVFTFFRDRLLSGELKAGDRFEIRPDQANWAAARAGWGARCLVMALGAGGQWAGVRVSGANLPRLRRATRFEHLAALGRVGTGRELVLEL